MIGSAQNIQKYRRLAMTAVAVGVACVATLRSSDTALLNTIRASHLSSRMKLLAAEADAEGSGRRGAAPLMHAAVVGSREAMRVLLDAGANVNAVATDGTTALMWATAGPAK